ncbi:Uncharacterised protein [uncultured archaeon]|nr:Uncharacterised protein [uncultured archaeon]
MKRTYHQFPQKPEFEQKYNFKADLPYIVKVMAGMDGQFGTFITDTPDLKGRPITAKRTIDIEIADRRTDFTSLNKYSLDPILEDVDSEGTIDFKVVLKYSFLDKKYDRVPFKGDSFFVRTNLENSVLALKVHHIEGMGRTECARIADTIVEEIRRNAPDV